MIFVRFFAAIIWYTLKVVDFFAPVIDLAARIWVAQIFFRAGLLKIQTWQTTLYLFQNEFHVPLLSPYLAAILGTSAELTLPILITIGLGGRITILIFFIYNIIAMVSYPFLWTTDGAQALAQHINWGLLLGLLMCFGSGKLSLDYWIHKKYGDYWHDYFSK